MRARRAEARRSSDRGICSRGPVVDERRVPYGKSNCRRLRFGDFCRSFLPERTSQPRCDLRSDAFPLQNHVAGDHGTAFCFAALHPAPGSPCGESPSQPCCDLRPDAFPLQNHVAGDHGTAFCFATLHPAHASPCGNLENPFRQKEPTRSLG